MKPQELEMYKLAGLQVCPSTSAVEQKRSTIQISGTVTDEFGQPLSSVNVYTDATTGTITDANGNYNLTVPIESVVNFSYMGFGLKSFSASDVPTTIRLDQEAEALDEVVVTDTVNKPNNIKYLGYSLLALLVIYAFTRKQPQKATI